LIVKDCLEKEGYTPKTINSLGEAVSSLFTAVFWRERMVNVKNCRNREAATKKI